MAANYGTSGRSDYANLGVSYVDSMQREFYFVDCLKHTQKQGLWLQI